jgi:hypothetical protein
VGAHWQSDVDASRTAASIGFCALQGSEEFIAQMKKAQAEYAEKTSQADHVRPAVIVEHPAARSFQMNGTPATDNTSGIVIEKNQKVVRK